MTTSCEPQQEDSGGGGNTAAKGGSGFSSAVLTLCLGILGSAVLPVPYAYSRTGVTAGLLASMAVALSNVLTSRLLIKTAARLNVYSYEELARAVGGRVWGVTARISLMCLLWGTLAGEVALLADIGKAAVADLGAPAWLLAGDGRVVMTGLTLCVVLPLCTLRQIRQLEAAGTGALSCLAVMAAVVVVNACRAGFPAIKSGELLLLKLSWNPQLPEAVSVFSYAFYVHPMLLPLLQELPRGRAGVDTLSNAVAAATLGVAYAVYALLGICAAGTYGLQTPGDIMAVRLLPGWGNGALGCLVALYLSASIPALGITLRYTLSSLLVGTLPDGERLPTSRQQDVGLAAVTLAPALGVALILPGSGAESIFAMTGATAGCLLCYCIPVACHYRLYFFGLRKKKAQQWRRVASGEAQAAQPLLLPPGLAVPWSDSLITHWIHTKKRAVQADEGSQTQPLLRPSPFASAPSDLIEAGIDAEAAASGAEGAYVQLNSADPAPDPASAVGGGGGGSRGSLRRMRSSALRDSMVSNASMDLRLYASFLDTQSLSRVERAWVWAEYVAAPAVVCTVGVVLSAGAVFLQLHG